MAKTKIVLLYERLSRDDELQGESFSIPPKIMLVNFARRQLSSRICPGWGLSESRISLSLLSYLTIISI